MITTTDGIILGFLSLFFILGFLKGFLRTILGPLCLLLGLIVGVIVQQKTNNLIYFSLTTIIAPFIFQILFSLILKSFSSPDKKAKLSIISRFAGGFFSAAWIGIFIFIVIFFISVLPSSLKPLKPIKKEIENSWSYSFFKKSTQTMTSKKFNIDDFNMTKIENMMSNPTQKAKIQKTQEYKDLMEDSRVKAVTEDADIQKMIEDKDYFGLLKSEKMQNMLKDSELVKKFLNLQKLMIEENQSKTNPPQMPAKTLNTKPIRLKDGVYTNH